MLKIIEKTTSVRYESDEDPIFNADFRLGKTIGALFLSIAYHKKTPDYITERMRNIPRIRYDTRVLILMIDTPNAERYMIELFEIALRYNFTILPVFDNNHAAETLLEIKTERDSALVQPQIKDNNSNQISLLKL